MLGFSAALLHRGGLILTPKYCFLLQPPCIVPEPEPCKVVSCQTSIMSSQLDSLEELEKLKKECKELKLKCTQLMTDNLEHVKEKEDLKKSLKLVTYDKNSFFDNNEKVRFFTGLTNWEVLLKLFEYIQPHLPSHESISPFQQLILTLMRL